MDRLRVITNEPIVYKRLLSKLKSNFGVKEIKIKKFQKTVLNFRFSKADWIDIAKDMEDLGYLELNLNANGRSKITVKRLWSIGRVYKQTK